jgi:hypothetical protein
MTRLPRWGTLFFLVVGLCGCRAKTAEANPATLGVSVDPKGELLVTEHGIGEGTMQGERIDYEARDARGTTIAKYVAARTSLQGNTVDVLVTIEVSQPCRLRLGSGLKELTVIRKGVVTQHGDEPATLDLEPGSHQVSFRGKLP